METWEIILLIGGPAFLLVVWLLIQQMGSLHGAWRKFAKSRKLQFFAGGSRVSPKIVGAYGDTPVEITLEPSAQDEDARPRTRFAAHFSVALPSGSNIASLLYEDVFGKHFGGASVAVGEDSLEGAFTFHSRDDEGLQALVTSPRAREALLQFAKDHKRCAVTAHRAVFVVDGVVKDPEVLIKGLDDVVAVVKDVERAQESLREEALSSAEEAETSAESAGGSGVRDPEAGQGEGSSEEESKGSSSGASSKEPASSNEKKTSDDAEAQREEEKGKEKAEEETRKKIQEEAERRAEEETRKKIQEEAKRKAEEEARKKMEEEAERKAEEEARKKMEEEAKRKAEEEARKKIEEEAKRKAEEEARKKMEEEAKRKAEEEARKKMEEEAKRKAEEEARKKMEEEAKRKAEEEARKKMEEEAKRKAEEEARKKMEEEAKREAEEEAKRKADEEAKRKADEEAKRKDAARKNKKGPEKVPLASLEKKPRKASVSDPDAGEGMSRARKVLDIPGLGDLGKKKKTEVEELDITVADPISGEEMESDEGVPTEPRQKSVQKEESAESGKQGKAEAGEAGAPREKREEELSVAATISQKKRGDFVSREEMELLFSGDLGPVDRRAIIQKLTKGTVACTVEVEEVTWTTGVGLRADIMMGHTVLGLTGDDQGITLRFSKGRSEAVKKYQPGDKLPVRGRIVDWDDVEKRLILEVR